MKAKPDHATTTPLQWVRVIPVAVKPRSAAERRALALASDENPDHVRATKIATLAALGCVLLLVVSQLLGCATPAGRLAAGAADITAQTRPLPRRAARAGGGGLTAADRGRNPRRPRVGRGAPDAGRRRPEGRERGACGAGRSSTDRGRGGAAAVAGRGAAGVSYG